MASPFFILSKLVGFFLRPESWLLILLLLALVSLWRGWRIVLGSSLGLAITFVLAIGLWPIGDMALAPLEARFPPRPSFENPAAIMVLGGGEEAERTAASGIPSIGARGDNLLNGTLLALKYPEAQVIFTGGTGWFRDDLPSGDTVARMIFTGAGIAPERLILEGRSRNTWQNAVFTRDLMGELPDGPTVIVTSAFHMHRSIGTFCAAGWDNLIAYPTDFQSFPHMWRLGWNFAANLAALGAAIKEHVGTVAYGLSGRFQPYEVIEGPEGPRIHCHNDV